MKLCRILKIRISVSIAIVNSKLPLFCEEEVLNPIKRAAIQAFFACGEQTDVIGAP